MPHVDALRKFIEEEQVNLWDDLVHAIDEATNGCWSMGAANVARRIVAAARLVGPTDPGDIPWRLHAGGVYAAILAACDIPAPETSADEWTRLDDLMASHGGTHSELFARYVGTRRALEETREIDFIRDAA